MSQIIKKSFITIIIFFLVWLLYQAGCWGYWYIMAWSMGSPDNYSRVVDTFRALPSETVIKRLHSIDMSSPYPQMAIKVLVERKEEKAVPELIKLTKSWNEHIRRDAIWALGLINDSRAIKPLMDIVNNGEKNSNYSDALITLARMKYDGAFSYAVKLAKDKNAVGNGSIAILKEFGKSEGILLLKDMKNRIREDDPLSKFDKNQINEAIKHIESLQNSK